MTREDSLRKFCYDHNIKVLDTNKRAHTYTKLNVSYFQYPNDLNIVDRHIVQDTEPLYTIEIALSELEKIAEFESQVFNHMRAKGHYDMFNMVMQQKEHEKILRKQYPAVQKAYEHYSLMLKMAESGDL